MSVYLFSILREEMVSVHKALFLHTKVWWLSWGKGLPLFELWAVLFGFFFSWNTVFLEGTASLDNGQIFSYKWRKYACHLKQVILFITNDEMQTFWQKLGFWKAFVYTCVLDYFPIFNDFSDEIDGDMLIMWF